MMRALRHPTTIRVAQIVTGVVFAWAGLAKLGDLSAFAQEVHNFRILPLATENLLAMTLPWIEILAGIGLILGIRSREAGVVCGSLAAVFCVAVLSAVLRGLSFECGCFGKAGASTVGLWKLAENVVLLAVALVASLPASGPSPRPLRVLSDSPTT